MSIKSLLFAAFFMSLVVSPAKAMFNSFEVGTATIASTFAPNPVTFTSFTFAEEFSATPLVFVLPSTQGGDECDVRIRNVSSMGFDAYCTEAPPRDGEHVAVNIQYVAILPGVTTVPSSAGPIIFEAGTIDTQAVQHNCASGCGTASWVHVDPSSVAPANAAIIGQIQTMENESGTPPSTSSEPFLSTAIDPSQGTVDEFGLALQRSEVNNGTITSDETIAWLAVENTGASCVTLDLSTLGGPASVPFQSIVTDDIAQGAPGDIHGPVDGWNDGSNNGCNANEGAEFASMCFSNTPVVVANKRTHNEEGGWLRQCNISTNEIRLTIDEDRDRDNERNHADEGISVLAFGMAFNTPVTLSHIAINQLGRNMTFDWETSTETFNIGFNLWGELNGEWVQLNKRIIPSKRKDQLQPNSYSKRIKLSAFQYEQMTQFGVSSVDVSGKDEFFGPFESGERYGKQVIADPIDWSKVKAQYVQRMKSKGYHLKNGIWQKLALKKDARLPTRVDMTIPETGIYRVSYEDIKALGVDWFNQKNRHIAVTYKGEPVARYILGRQGRFKPGSSIEFFATVPLGNDARYIDANVYQLQLDQSLALAMPFIAHDATDNANDASNVGLKVNTLSKDNVYNSLASGDPWMDSDVFSFGEPSEKKYTLVLNDVAVGSGGRLRGSLIGGLNLPGPELDHHVQIYVNDVLIADKRSDGFQRFDIDEAIPAGVLIRGNNIVRVVVPGDTGLAFDLVSIDAIEVYYGQELAWSSSQETALEFITETGVESYVVTLSEKFKRQKTRIYATQSNGNVARITRPKRDRSVPDGSLVLPVTAMQNDLDDDVHYWLGSTDQMLTPDLELVRASDALISEGTDYLIVAHPAFINQELMDFAEAKTNSGLSTEIVSWLDIVQKYGHGLATPEALRNFLTEANVQSNYEYVLIVGGHSYDYLDYLGNGSVNFIPAWYGEVDVIQQAPTDTPFVDLDADGLPDKAIGRWPVRTQQDLTAIIQKTFEWQESGVNSSRNSLLIAGKTEANRDYGKLLLGAMSPVTKRWTDITHVFLDEVVEREGLNANAVARQEILDNVNQGVSLTVFNGHASPSAWALDSLLTSNDVLSLENAGLPTLLMPLACYITYYETPTVDSLAHQWLFASQDSADTTGAVGIHGATVFSDYHENTLFAEKVLKRQLDHEETIGQAILSVKKQLSPWHNMVNNWGLLGDPSIRLVP
ncbi:MAG: C25 family cysteine peptidase [Arenicella sp.]